MTSTLPRKRRSRSTTAPLCGSARWATLCAETLAGIADPLFPALAAARTVAPAAAARAALGALVEPLDSPAPPEAPPSWLLPHQADAVTRARAVLARFNGVLIADGVGLGKTFIALALVALERRRGGDAVAVVPAAVRGEWAEACRKSGVPLGVFTHTEVARRLPALRADCSLVVVDEAHAFRNPRTRRYDALARLAVGRRVALLTATPLNNSRADLAALIELFAGRDRFREFGVADLSVALADGDTAPASLALGALSVCRTRRLVEERFPSLRSAFPRRLLLRPARYDLDACYGGTLDQLLDRLSGLAARGDHDQAGASLVHLGLLRRLESSRDALLRSLRRHQAVLDELARARAEGVRVGRREVRAFLTRDDADASQLALWPLLAPAGPAAGNNDLDRWRHAIALALALVEGAAPQPDPKLAALEALLDRELTGRKTIVFTEYRDTAHALFRQLRRRRRVIAVVGDAAWAGADRLSRDEALDAFAPRSRGRTADPLLDADVLIATDVAGEGLNLQDASAVVNYDLPWNPVRVMQRVGRIDRLDSSHAEVLVAHLVPERGLPAMTRVLERLRDKLDGATRLPGAEPDPLAALWWLAHGAPAPQAVERESWRRVEAFEARERWRAWAGEIGRERVPLVAAGLADDGGPPEAGLLLALEWRDGRRTPLPYHVVAGGPPRLDAEAVGRLAGRALGAAALPCKASDFAQLLAAALPDARGRLLAQSAARRGGCAGGPGRSAALEALTRAAARAARQRSDTRVFERAGESLARELPAGLDRLLSRLLAEPGDPQELAGRIAELLEACAPPAGPDLAGVPCLVVVAAIALATTCPTDGGGAVTTYD